MQVQEKKGMGEMLKRYTAGDRVQWVGRAWEIRRALQQEMKKSGGKARLTELIGGSKKTSAPRIVGPYDRS